MDDYGLKKTRAMQRLENELRPGPISRFLRAINPATSLGSKAGKDFHQNSLTISLIMIFSLVIAIITTVMFTQINDDSSIRIREKNFIVAAMSISWFVFVNFTFLVVEGTRLFNILLFIVLLALISMVTTELNQSSSEAKLGIASIALGAIVLSILLYFYIFTDSEEAVQIKTLERERLRREKLNLMMEQWRRDAKKLAKEELTADVTSKEGIKNKIATAYIDALESKIRKDILAPKEKKDDKNKDKDKEKKDDKKGE